MRGGFTEGVVQTIPPFSPLQTGGSAPTPRKFLVFHTKWKNLGACCDRIFKKGRKTAHPKRPKSFCTGGGLPHHPLPTLLKPLQPEKNLSQPHSTLGGGGRIGPGTIRQVKLSTTEHLVGVPGSCHVSGLHPVRDLFGTVKSAI